MSSSDSPTALPAIAMRKAIRRAAGRSLADLAAKLQVSRQSVSFWERGLIEPAGAHLGEYARLLEDLRKEAAETLAATEAAS